MKKIGGKTSTAVIYIGVDRYQSLATHAREISYIANANITPSAFLHYLIEEYINEGHLSLLKKLNSHSDDQQ